MGRARSAWQLSSWLMTARRAPYTHPSHTPCHPCALTTLQITVVTYNPDYDILTVTGINFLLSRSGRIWKQITFMLPDNC